LPAPTEEEFNEDVSNEKSLDCVVGNRGRVQREESRQRQWEQAFNLDRSNRKSLGWRQQEQEFNHARFSEKSLDCANGVQL
jgi:hypothetical protein